MDNINDKTESNIYINSFHKLDIKDYGKNDKN